MEEGTVVQINQECWQVFSRYRGYIGVVVYMENPDVAKIRLVNPEQGHFHQYVSIKFLDVVG